MHWEHFLPRFSIFRQIIYFGCIYLKQKMLLTYYSNQIGYRHV